MLMQSGGRVPRFQRKLCRSRKREKTPYISRVPFEPQMITKVVDNLVLLITSIFEQNPCWFTKDQIDVAYHPTNHPDTKLRTLVQHILVSTGYAVNTASISLYYIYAYITDESNVYAFESREAALIAALMIANKAYDDTHISSAKWSQLSHIPSRVLMESEQNLLEGLDWNLYLSKEEFLAWGQRMHEILIASIRK